MTAQSHRVVRGGLLVGSLLLVSLVHQVDAETGPVSPPGADHAGARPARPVAADRDDAPAGDALPVVAERWMMEPDWAGAPAGAVGEPVQPAPLPVAPTLAPGSTDVRTDLDCNGNGIADQADIAGGFSLDVNTNSIPDECDLTYCDPLWDGFSAYLPGDLVSAIDVNGDGVFWQNPLGSATIQNVGCEGGPIDFGVAVVGDWNLADPTVGYVESEYLRTVNGALDCGSAIYTLTFKAKLGTTINSKLDWEYVLYDAKSGQRVVQLEFPSTVSNTVPTAQRGKVLVKNPAGSPAYLSTNVAIALNTCLTIKIELNNVTNAVSVCVNDLVTPKVVTTRLDADAQRVDYFRIQAIKNSAASGSAFSRFCLDAAELCVSGSALMTWTDCNANCVDDAWDVAGGNSADCNTNGIPDECDIAAASSSDCNSNALPDECDLASGTSADCNGNGVTDECDVSGGTGTDCNENGVLDECEGLGAAAVLYVDGDAPGSNNGTSWDDALHELRAALCLAAREPGVTEIRVAEGLYRPAGAGGPRTRTLQLVNGAAVLGGFAGYGQANPDERDVDLYETVLSGDLNGDDGPDFAHNTENSYHVVTGSGTAPTAILDGFTITGGHAEPASAAGSAYYGGGGMYNYSGSPTVTSCTFRGNAATEQHAKGGAMLNYVASHPVVSHCSFEGNYGKSGGGIGNETGSAPVITDCRFTSNSGFWGGGLINSRDSNATIQGCTFSENVAPYGGSMYNGRNSAAFVSRCLFVRNHSVLEGDGYGGGGAMFNYQSNPIVGDCRFEGNTASGAFGGGGICNEDYSVPVISNCLFVGNSAPTGYGGAVSNSPYGAGAGSTVVSSLFVGNSACEGGAVYAGFDAGITLINCLLNGNEAGGGSDCGWGGAVSSWSGATVVNCTCYENTATQYVGGLSLRSYDDSVVTVTNSILWGNMDGAGGNETAQLYAYDAAGRVNYTCVESWSGLYGGTGNFGQPPMFMNRTGLDGVPGNEDDDLRLAAGSPGIDAGSNGAVPADLTDLDGDGDTAERLPFDLIGNPRFVDDPATPDTGVGDPPGYPAVVDLGAYEYQGIPCDLTYDGVVDEDDYWAHVDAFSTCVGDAKYVAAADLDGDGCVTIVDYQLWLQCYRMVNGQAFRLPRPK